MSDLSPPGWASDPSKYPSAGESASVRQAAIRASTFTLKRRVVESARKARFVLSKAQQKQVPIVAQFQQNAEAEVYAAYYVGLELAVACATTNMESKGLNIYGADPASSWMNNGPYGELWEHGVTEQSYKWFGARVDQGYTSNGVGQKQLTARSLQVAADARGGCWVPEHCCAEGDVFFLELIRQSGSIWRAFYSYNGSGPAAVNYANEAVGLVAGFRAKGVA
jgi:hypothetical protein